VITVMKEVRYAVAFTITTMIVFGGAYPLAVWAIGRVAFQQQAEGSLIRRADGTVAGSRLIAQGFSQPQYFHPRPSAVDYNAASPGGSNHAPSNPDHQKAVAGRLGAITALERVTADQVPSEMVTASGSGLDPHVSPEAAALQVTRVAAARGVSPDQIRGLVRSHILPPTFGILGRARINVLELNRALDAALPSR
jgi:K+-transporting ATPase ATPase C chain